MEDASLRGGSLEAGLDTGPQAAIVRNKGVFQDEETALAQVLQRLVDVFDPSGIWLFGSRATGEARPDSDFDLLVVAKEDAIFGSDDYEKIIEPLRGLGVGCDVIPCSAADFVEAGQIRTSLVAQVLQQGRQLYDAKAG